MKEEDEPPQPQEGIHQTSITEVIREVALQEMFTAEEAQEAKVQDITEVIQIPTDEVHVLQEDTLIIQVDEVRVLEITQTIEVLHLQGTEVQHLEVLQETTRQTVEIEVLQDLVVILLLVEVLLLEVIRIKDLRREIILRVAEAGLLLEEIQEEGNNLIFITLIKRLLNKI